MDETVNDALRELRKRNIPYVEITSGYYVGRANTYLLCQCDGNGELGQLKCECGAVVYCCVDCARNGLITHCPKCTGVFKKRRKAFAKIVGKPWDVVARELIRLKRQLDTPIDFVKLIAEGKLERVSATRFKLLVDLAELPKHVRMQIIAVEQLGKKGKVVTVIRFPRRKRPKA